MGLSILRNHTRYGSHSSVNALLKNKASENFLTEEYNVNDVISMIDN